MRRMPKALLAGLLVLAAGPPAHAALTRVYPVSADDAWRVAESILRSLGWDIDERDASAGVLVTGSQDVAFRDYAVYGEGTRHRLRVTVVPATGEKISITVRRELFHEERILWVKTRRMIESTDTQLEHRVLDAIARGLPTPAPRSAERPRAPAPAAPPTAVRTYRVTYRVSGQAARTTIDYRTPRGPIEHRTTPSLPWAVSLDVPAGDALHLTASGRALWGESSIACEILVDGVVLAKATGVGFAAVATCKATADR